MKKPLSFLFLWVCLLTCCCPKTDDCNCVQNEVSLVCQFNYSNINSVVTAYDSESKLPIDSFYIRAEDPFYFRLTAACFKHRKVSLRKDNITFRDVNTNHSDSITQFKILADTIESECNKCWIGQSDKVSCAEIKSYDLIFNNVHYPSNELLIEQPH